MKRKALSNLRCIFMKRPRIGERHLQRSVLYGALVVIPVSLGAFFSLMVPLVYGGSYNRTAARDYANANAHTRPAGYPNYGDPGSCQNCLDCTNFGSQVLEAGSYPQRDGADDVWHWFCSRKWWGWSVSHTWRVTPDFNTYVHQYPAEFSIVCWPGCLETADFILLDLRDNDGNGGPDGIPDHVRVHVGTGWISQAQADYTDGCGGNRPIPSPTYTQLVSQHLASIV